MFIRLCFKNSLLERLEKLNRTLSNSTQKLEKSKCEPIFIKNSKIAYIIREINANKEFKNFIYCHHYKESLTSAFFISLLPLFLIMVMIVLQDFNR